MPSTAIWMDLENIIISELSQTKEEMVYITYVELKNNINECIYKTETDLQIQKTKLWLPREKEQERDKLRVQDYQIQTSINKIDNRIYCMAQEIITNIL